MNYQPWSTVSRAINQAMTGVERLACRRHRWRRRYRHRRCRHCFYCHRRNRRRCRHRRHRRCRHCRRCCSCFFSFNGKWMLLLVRMQPPRGDTSPIFWARADPIVLGVDPGQIRVSWTWLNWPTSLLLAWALNRQKHKNLWAQVELLWAFWNNARQSSSQRAI